MRVLMVTNTYAPARNGVAAFVHTLRGELVARGHVVDVLTGRLPGRDPDSGVREVATVRGFAADFPLPVAFGAAGRVAGERYDVVHVHHPVLLGPVGLRVADACSARTVFTAHSVYTDYLDHYVLGLGRPLKRAAAARLRRFVDRFELVLAPSSHVGRVLRDWGVGTRIAPIEPPADVAAASSAEARARLGVAPDERLVLSVGRLAPEKRFDVVLREFARVAPGIPGVRLAVAGDGPERERLARLASSLGVGDRVRFLGAMDQRALGSWYAAADLLACASLSETGPMTVVEAMVCGTPTVAFHAPGYEDRIASGENGILVEQRDGELGAAMRSVLTDEGLAASLAAGARARAAEHAPGRVAEVLLGYYAELLDRS